MTLERFIDYLLIGISVGGQYALIAIGYTMVYGILRLINFAHGDIFMMAGFFMVFLASSIGIYAAIPVTLIATVPFAESCVLYNRRYKPALSAHSLSFENI